MSPGTFLFIVNGEAPVMSAGPDRDPTCRVENPGKKRPHYKSRRGCLACKRRRVKCDEQFPCSNCSKGHERCIHSKAAKGSSAELSTRISQPPSSEVLAGGSVNLLHLELFSHFQRDLVDTLAFSEIWEQVLPWSFQEPYIMYTILCFAATHLSTLRPQDSRYSNVASQLLSKAVSLFGQQLSNPITVRNSEALISVSILMHYISWSRIEFIERQERLQHSRVNSLLTMHLSNDPLLQLSFGVQGILCEAYHILADSGSVFRTTGLYSPIYAIEEAIVQQGENPWRFVKHFMGFSYDPLLVQDCDDDQSLRNAKALSCPDTNEGNAKTASASPRCTPKSREAMFESVAKRLSLLFCLVSMSASPSPSASQTLMRLQLDIERCFFSFPVHYSGAFRELALQGDPRALVILCHFYRAARILLTSPRNWWARQRSCVIESLILQDLTSRGLGTCILSEGLQSWG
ncbi:hypothetical protein F4859DRAFT_404200 [Xylaria cf. heliscus]|nr:hypothetical protein F4859DRAFT_404200 [Xylaria cf. heliscus]